jgi:hypothetical protein
MINRRTLLKAGLAAVPLASTGSGAAKGDTSWSSTVRRIGQLNMTEHDPAVLDVEQWADYWASLKVDAVLVSVTGIIAFYQTKVPFHRKSKFLGDRDFFGDCCAAAKKRRMRVVARMSPDLNWEDAVPAHPEWFQRDAQGNAHQHTEDPRLFRTCMFSTYMTDYIPAIMREVSGLYDIDAIYTNGWPPMGNMPVCFCEQCRRLPSSGTPDYWDKFNERTIYLWKLYDSIAKGKNLSNFYFGNLGDNIHAAPNLRSLGDICQWFQCDNQGRGGDDTPVWGVAFQGRVCRAVQKGKMSTNVTGAWSTGSVRWRNAAKSPAETEMWLDQTVASGMAPYYHFIGGEKGLGEDRRWMRTGRRFFNWTAAHDRHFVNTVSIANLGVVMGQRTQLFYTAPHGAVNQYMHGLYYALLEGRFLFDFIHEDGLASEDLKKYSALLLPNIALLSDRQCEQLRAYVDGGGSLLATFETGMYTERNERRSDFGLADVFGIHKAAEVKGTNGNACYARIERQHSILAGFTDTNWIPGTEYRLPIAPVAAPVLTVVPGFVAYPPELAYPPQSQTDEPAVVVRERGASRLIYFPGDIERTMWRSGHTDLSQLLQNSIRWVSGGGSPVTVEGDGLIETFAWETQAGFALHILNYTNPNLHRGWIRKFYPIAEQKVRMKVPVERRVTGVELLRAETQAPFRVSGDAIEFTIPKVIDYEVAAISTS